jgi:hemolysin D
MAASDQTSAVRSERHREELEFLPAALEALETPPSPTARIFAIGLIVMMIAALTWSIIGTLDVVVVGQGKLIPIGNVKQIQTRDIGVVTAIHVVEGQQVTEGELLIELDRSEQKAGLEVSQRNWLDATLEVARLEAELRVLNGGETRFIPPSEAPSQLSDMHRRQLIANAEVLRAAIDALRFQQRAREAEIQSQASQIDKLNSQLTFYEDREKGLRELLQRGFTSEASWREAQAQVMTARKDVEIAEHNLNRAQYELKKVTRDITNLVIGERKSVLDRLIAAQSRAAEAQKNIDKFEAQTIRTEIRAPITGVVQNLSIHTIGGVVSPQKDLMTLVPLGSSLRVEAMVNNQDIGFIRPGQIASVKIDSFPFTTYGFIEGSVLTVSRDSVLVQNSYVFPVQLSLARADVLAGGRTVPLTPGMTVSAEIKVRERRIINFFLDPITRHWAESMRER